MSLRDKDSGKGQPRYINDSNCSRCTGAERGGETRKEGGGREKVRADPIAMEYYAF